MTAAGADRTRGRLMTLMALLLGLVGLLAWRAVQPESVRSPPAPWRALPELRAGVEVRVARAARWPRRYHARLPVGAARFELRDAGLDLRLCLARGAEPAHVCVDRPAERGPVQLVELVERAADYVVSVEYEAQAASGFRLRLSSQAADARTARQAQAQRLEYEADQATRDQRDQGLSRAVASCERAVALWRELPEARELAAALRHCAGLQAARGAYGAARMRLHEAVDVSAAAGDAQGEAQARGEWAAFEAHVWQQGARVAALAEAALRSDDPRARALGLRARGEYAANRGSLDAAADDLRDALELWQQVGDLRGAADTHVALGEAYTLVGRDVDAREHFEAALDVRRRLRDFGGVAEARAQLGWLRYLAHDCTSALESLTEATPTLETLGRLPDLAGVLDRRASVLGCLGRTDDARRDYQRALALTRTAGDEVSTARVQLNLVDVDVDPDAEAPDEALESLRRAGDREALAGLLLGRARRHAARGELGVAVRVGEDAIAELERQRSDIKVPISRMAFLATRHKFYAFLVSMLMRLDQREPGRGHAARAFEAAERARARTLLDTLVAPPAAGHSAPEPGPAPTPVAQLDRDDYRRARALAAVPPVTLAQVQSELLDDDTLLLAYSLGDERSYLWLVGRERFEVHALGPRADIESLANEAARCFVRSGRRRAREATRWAAARLSDAILGPVADRLGSARLVIVSDGALAYVPFAALPAPPRPGRRSGRTEAPVPLLAEHEIVSVPSASVLLSLRAAQRHRRPAPNLVAVVADPVFEQGDPRFKPVAGGETLPPTLTRSREELGARAREAGLPRYGRLVYSGVESKAIQALVERRGGLFLTGFEATREAVLAGRLAMHRIVHFATHGVLDDRDPRRSGLVLSERDAQGRALDPYLRVHDLRRVRLDADLVVLSACRTGLGTDLRGEGLVGLTQGFLQAGALRVIVSLWAVDDRATAAFMQAFYRALLLRDLPPAQALRAAQLELLRQPEFAAPQHWGAFAYLGDWANWPVTSEPLNVGGF